MVINIEEFYRNAYTKIKDTNQRKKRLTHDMKWLTLVGDTESIKIVEKIAMECWGFCK